MTNANNRTTKTDPGTSMVAKVTPTGLEQRDVRGIVDAITPVIADGFALYEKMKNVSLSGFGPRSSELQLLLDEQAQEIFASTDSLAEQLRRLGATTPRSISHTGELQRIDDYKPHVLSPDEMLNDLISDNENLATALTRAGKIFEKIGAGPIGNILQDVLEKTETRSRLLKKIATRS